MQEYSGFMHLEWREVMLDMNGPFHHDDEYWKEVRKREEQNFDMILTGVLLMLISLIIEGICWLIGLWSDKDGH